MANISTYPIGTPGSGDLIPGTQLFTDENGKTHNLTKNFTVSSLNAMVAAPTFVTLRKTITTAQLKTLGSAAVQLLAIPSGSPQELIQIMGVQFYMQNQTTSNKLAFGNNIETDLKGVTGAFKYVLPSAVANSTTSGQQFYVPTLTAGYSGVDSDLTLVTSGNPVETGTATTTLDIWITYRLIDIAQINP